MTEWELYEGEIFVEGDTAHLTCGCGREIWLALDMPQTVYCLCGMAYAVGLTGLEAGRVYVRRYDADTILSIFDEQ